MVTFLSHFTPSMMPEDVIERIFVQRKHLATRLVTLVRESILGAEKHHSLIVGPRGIGKTHLASLVYHRIRAIPELTDRTRIVWLREEEWGVASFLDFVVRVLRALQEEYPNDALASRVEALYALPAEHAEREAVSILDDFVGDRTVFLITENLDQLFEGLGDEGQKQFRAYLQDRATWTILATSPGLFNGISLQNSPFYGFFRVRHLKELSVDEAVELLQKIAELSGRDELASFVRTPVGRARIRAVHHLAGGNHRIYVIFSEFLTRETLDDLVDPFLTTMDHLTPYYQARMQSLSPQQRKIVDYLCEIRHAVPVKDISQRCFVTQQTASSQLKQLKERGFVRSFSVGRESYYELTEPLLRLSLEVKKQRGEPIRLFVDFLRYWYTKSELEQRLVAAEVTNPVDHEYFFRALQEWDATPVAQSAQIKEWEGQLYKCFKQGDFVGAREFAESLVHMRGASYDYVNKATCLSAAGEFEPALLCLEDARKSAPDEPAVLLALAGSYATMGRVTDAIDLLDRSELMTDMPAIGWELRAVILSHIDRLDEAIVAYRHSVRLDPTSVSARVGLASILFRSERYQESLEVVTVEYSNGNPQLLDLRAAALASLKDLDAAAETYLQSLALEENARRRTSLARVLLDANKLNEAEVHIAHAISLDPEEPLAWIYMSQFQFLRGDPRAASEAAVRASELRPQTSEFQLLAGTYLEAAHEPTEAIHYYERAIELGGQPLLPAFRIAAALAAREEWEHAISALRDIMLSSDEIPGDFRAGEDLLRSWFLFRSDSQWGEELPVIADLYIRRYLHQLLSTAITKSLGMIVSNTKAPTLARKWVAVWTSLAERYPELKVGTRLLSAGAEYHLTGDPRHLLELASEERAMVESIPGIRPLSAWSEGA